MVEEAERLAARERRQPERQSRELDRDGIDVNSGEATLRHEAPHIRSPSWFRSVSEHVLPRSSASGTPTRGSGTPPRGTLRCPWPDRRHGARESSRTCVSHERRERPADDELGKRLRRVKRTGLFATERVSRPAGSAGHAIDGGAGIEIEDALDTAPSCSTPRSEYVISSRPPGPARVPSETSARPSAASRVAVIRLGRETCWLDSSDGAAARANRRPLKGRTIRSPVRQPLRASRVMAASPSHHPAGAARSLSASGRASSSNTRDDRSDVRAARVGAIRRRAGTGCGTRASATHRRRDWPGVRTRPAIGDRGNRVKGIDDAVLQSSRTRS